jgi:hypothetical protein
MHPLHRRRVEEEEEEEECAGATFPTSCQAETLYRKKVLTSKIQTNSSVECFICVVLERN